MPMFDRRDEALNVEVIEPAELMYLDHLGQQNLLISLFEEKSVSGWQECQCRP